VIKDELCKADILPKNCYDMGETDIILSMLVGKDDQRDSRGAGELRTMITAIKCISASGEALEPLIIWPACSRQSNRTSLRRD
jgi:hypothetical protein